MPTDGRPTRIAIVTDAWLPQVNGVVTTLRSVRAHLEDALDRAVFVIQPQQFTTIACPKYDEIRLSVLPGRRLGRMLRDIEPDAVHIATEGPLGVAARRFCGRHGWAFTTSYHTQFPSYVQKYAGIPPSITWRGIRWFHGAAALTLVPTESIRRELEENGLTKLRVWTRGVDRSIFHPRPGDDLFADLPRPLCLYAGRVAREKNIEAFLDADLPGTKIVVGGGPELAGLKAKYRDVVFTGFKHGDELGRHYAACDVFVFPSRTDTFGVVLLEAMASGVPVAAYPVAGPRDVVPPSAGCLDEDLTRAVRGALELDPETCRAYAEQFTWARCGDIFDDTLVDRRNGAELPRAAALAT